MATIPQWLNPPDIAGQYASGLHAGLQVGMERNRLAQQAQMAEMQAQAREAEFQRESLRQKTEMDIQKAYQQAQLGIRKRELDQQQQSITLATQKAARQVAAQQAYRKLIESGVDPSKALLQIGPDLGVSMTGAAQLYKAGLPQPVLPPPSVQTFDGEKFLKVPTRTGSHYQPLRPDTDITAGDRARISVLQRRRTALQSDILPITPKSEELQKDQADKKRQIAAIDRELDQIAPPSSVRSASNNNIPQAAIDHLQQNPDLRDLFDDKYGEGSAASVLGE